LTSFSKETKTLTISLKQKEFFSLYFVETLTQFLKMRTIAFHSKFKIVICCRGICYLKMTWEQLNSEMFHIWMKMLKIYYAHPLVKSFKGNSFNSLKFVLNVSYLNKKWRNYVWEAAFLITGQVKLPFLKNLPAIFLKLYLLILLPPIKF
jgi:hypothetical protein